MDIVGPYTSQKHQDVVAMVGLDAMKRANSTLEDFVSPSSLQSIVFLSFCLGLVKIDIRIDFCRKMEQV